MVNVKMVNCSKMTSLGSLCQSSLTSPPRLLLSASVGCDVSRFEDVGLLDEVEVVGGAVEGTKPHKLTYRMLCIGK